MDWYIVLIVFLTGALFGGLSWIVKLRNFLNEKGDDYTFKFGIKNIIDFSAEAGTGLALSVFLFYGSLYIKPDIPLEVRLALSSAIAFFGPEEFIRIINRIRGKQEIVRRRKDGKESTDKEK